MSYFLNRFSLIAFISSVLPLAGTVAWNFEYEYIWQAAILVLLLLCTFGLFAPRSSQKANSLVQMTTAAGLFLILPTFFIQTSLCLCNPQQLYFWYFVLWLPAWFTGATLYFFQIHSKNKIKTYLSVALGITTITAVEGLILFFLPQKRIVSMFFGFLHGPVYDDYISVSYSVIFLQWFQTIILALVLGAGFYNAKKSSYSRVFILVAFALTFLVSFFVGQLTPSTGHGLHSLQKALPEVAVGPHYRLHYSKALEVNHKNELELLVRETSFHLEDLLADLQIKQTKPIEIFVYDSSEQKKQLFGGAETDITDIRTPSVHTTLKAYPHPTIRHELVHAVLAAYGFHGLGFHPNMAITEGIAVALAPNWSSWTLNELATSYLSERTRATDSRLGRVFSPLFWLENPQISYNLSGAFLQYLIETYDTKSTLALYQGSTFKKAFKKDFQVLKNEWQSKLKSGVDQNKVEQILFEAKQLRPVFRSKCSHSRAINRRENLRFLDQIRSHPGRVSTKDYWNWRLEMEPEQVYLQTRALKNKAIEGLQKNFIRSSEKIVAANTDIHSKITALDALKDIHLIKGNTKQATKIIDALQGPEFLKSLPPAKLRKILLQREMMADDSEISKRWQGYLTGAHGDGKYTVLEQAVSWPQLYLLLRNNPQAISDELLKAMSAKPIVLHQTEGFEKYFYLEWHRLLAEEFTRRGVYMQAQQQYSQAVRFASGSFKKNLLIQSRFLKSL